MKITVLAHGSRGDVQPPLALAHHLHVLGHAVRVVLPSDFAAVAERLGLEVQTLPFAVSEMLAEGDLIPKLRQGRTLAFFKEGFERDQVRRGAVMTALVRALTDTDLALVPALLEDLALSVAEKNEVPVALTLPMPTWANAQYPSFMFSSWRVPRWLNRATHWLLERAARDMLPSINESRATLGLAPVSERPGLAIQRTQVPVFYWIAPEVMPPPPEFGDNHHFTGYWSVPPALRQAFGEREPSAELIRFLDAGPPPLYVGFGSMPVMDDRVLDIAMQAARALDLRLVLSRGGAEVATRDDNVCLIDNVDHDWLFPRCAAVVHHGGASTTGAAIRSGRPQIVCAVFADQPMWGRRVAALGVGEMLRFQDLSLAALIRVLTRVRRTEVQAAAASLATRLATRPCGALVAAQIIDEHFTR